MRMKWYFDNVSNTIKLEVGRDIFEFTAEYSEYEDCVDLVLYKDDLEVLREKEFFILPDNE